MAQNSGSIVAKYTQKNHANQFDIKKTKAANSDEIVAKYTKHQQTSRPCFSTSLDNFRSEPFDFSRLSISKPKIVEAAASSSTATWTLWSYDCRDVPVHTCFYNPCRYCDVMHQLQLFSKATDDESKDRWDNYLQKGKTFGDKQKLLDDDGLAELLPSILAKDIYFNRKLGVGVFRDDIVPNNESAENSAGGVFQMLFMATAGERSTALLSKFDAFFLQTLRLIVDAEPTVVCHVNGLFYRCYINPGKGLQRELEPYGDMADLPFMGKLEVWIDDEEHFELLQLSLIKELNKTIKELQIPHRAFREFSFVKRVHNGLYFPITSAWRIRNN
uniref:DUF3480 domain-containing protein n=1 Tax=Globodera pallida TaxID=36090 RepID=A0A183C5X0_GLOPA